MTLATMPSALDATSSGAVGAFNVITLEQAEAVAAGAEAAGLPVVLQISQNTVDWHGALEPLAAACLAIARASTADVVVHLDHATRVDLVEQAVALGMTSVMYDGSTLEDETNVATTADVVARCHAAGVWVEAELGEIGGKGGAHTPGVRTDPADAEAFVARTGVDALAVAVGSSHAMITRDARLDTDLIATLAARVPVPLVLHGSSGVPESGLVEAVTAGMRKVNIATHLNQQMTRAIRAALADRPDLVDPRRYLASGRSVVGDEIRHLLGLLAGTAASRDGDGDGV